MLSRLNFGFLCPKSTIRSLFFHSESLYIVFRVLIRLSDVKKPLEELNVACIGLKLCPIVTLGFLRSKNDLKSRSLGSGNLEIVNRAPTRLSSVLIELFSVRSHLRSEIKLKRTKIVFRSLNRLFSVQSRV